MPNNSTTKNISHDRSMIEECKIHNFKQLRTGLLVMAALIFCWGIWSVPILAHNEARRMVVVQEMLKSGNWLVPTLNGEFYLAKPPLLYWLMAATCKLFSSQAEWAMRLPSSLMAVALLGLFLRKAARYLGQGPALFGVAILASSESFIEFARTAQIEMLLTFTLSLSVFWFLDYLTSQKKVWLTLSYAALGAAILTKGPVALLFFLPPALVFSLVRKDSKTLRGLGSIPGWSVALLVALPWFVYIFLEHKTLLGHVINEDIADKVAGVTKSSPLYTYPLFLVGAFAPWILLVFYRPKIQLQKVVAAYEQQYFLIFALVPVLLMSFVSEKHGKYLLPIFPCLAMVLGVWCHSFYRSWTPERTRRLLLWAVGTLLASHFLFQVVITPRLYNYRFVTLKPMAATINNLAGNRPVYSHKEAIIQLIYYAGRPLPVKKTQEIEEMIKANESFLLVASSKTMQELSATQLCLIEEFSPFLKKNRSAKLLGYGDFCSPDLRAPNKAAEP